MKAKVFEIGEGVMPAVSRVLVVGAGTAGTATTILLARAGVEVDLAEARPEVTALGSGITLQGNALRVLCQLGVLDAVLAAGYAYDRFAMRAADARATPVAELPEARSGGQDVPAVVGMLRPDLARILANQAGHAGARIRLGTAVARLEPSADGVSVAFTDGSAGRYDLVVGADGIRSSVRGMLGIQEGPRPTGLDAWRATGPRPADVTRTELYHGGSACAAGYTPTGANSMYGFIVAPSEALALAPQERLARFRELSGAYHGPWDDFRAAITDPGQVNCTRVESQILPAPWNRGRVVLIGDAAHACPPTLAQGAAMALEDAAVLAELLLSRPRVDDGLWAAFTARRHARAKWVIDTSVEICEWVLAGNLSGLAGRFRDLYDLVSVPA